MGSRDRRLASGFVYNYFRIGKALQDVRMIERLTIANFLCSTETHPLLSYCLEKFSLINGEVMKSSLQEKISEIRNHYEQFNPEKIFPFAEHLSDRINKKKFIESFLQQPGLWIRIRNGFREKVLDEFVEKKILFEVDDHHPLSLSLVNSTSLEKTDAFLKGYFEIQDWSSQQMIRYIQPKPNETWWDACAGSGGKSLMMMDAEPTVTILASDSRASMLKNMEERFNKAGTKNHKTIHLDLSKPISDSQLPFTGFDTILADVPCSGSGTWARTPEWLLMFDEKSLIHYVTLQRNIIKNLSGSLEKDKRLVFITCSVFTEENEKNVAWIPANTALTLLDTAYMEGWAKGADSMFVATFIKQ